MVRIKDIAKKAGVSSTTVSNVIHGNTKRVSREKVERIKKILEENNYVPSMASRLLSREDSNIIGVIVAYPKRDQRNATEDPFIGEMLGDLEEYLREQGFYMLFYAAEEPLEIFKMASTWRTDGLLIFGFNETSCIVLRKQTEIPFVTIDSYLDGQLQENSANVGSDDFDGGYQMGSYLVECGHRDMAFLSDNNTGVDRRRFLGFQKALHEAGVSCTEDWHIILERDKYSRRAQLKKNLECFRKKTALFCASDYYAAELINFLGDNGLRVPEDISVAGFDDSNFAELIRPRLTTVRQDIKKKAAAAIDTLFSYIEGKEVEERDQKLPVKLIVRDSVKNL